MSSTEGLRETAARTQVTRPALAPASATAPMADRLPVRQPAADRFWRDVRRRRMLAVADVGAAGVASLLVAGSTTSVMWALALLPGWVLIAKLFGLYDRDQRSIRHLTFDEMPVIAAWVAACTATLGLVLSLTPVGPVKLGVLVAAWLVVTLVAGVLRGTMRWLWRQTTPPELTAVLGEGELASAARRKLELFRDMHLRLVDDGGLPLDGIDDDRAASLRQLILGLDRVIVAMEWIDPELIGQLAGICRDEQVKLSVVSPLRGRAGASPHLSAVAELPVLEYDTRDPSRSTMLIKRVFDVFFCASALVVLAPLFPLVLLAIKLDSRGPVFFTQLRAGRGGVPFRLYKLRTMVADAERALPDVVVLEDLPEPMFKLRADPRVTRVGRLLRRLSLDELPQLVNVLRGEMSIVGPRPEQVELVERYLPEHRFRLDVSPGMTGPMQVYGRGDLDFSERLAVEFDYVENLSLTRDLSILVQTIPVVIRGHGAY